MCLGDKETNTQLDGVHVFFSCLEKEGPNEQTIINRFGGPCRGGGVAFDDPFDIPRHPMSSQDTQMVGRSGGFLDCFGLLSITRLWTYIFVPCMCDCIWCDQGVAVADIKQQTLLDQVKITQFEGISGWKERAIGCLTHASDQKWNSMRDLKKTRYNSGIFALLSSLGTMP